MLVSPEIAIAGGESQCRHPSIQHQFVLVGLGERAGSGVPKIVQAWRSQHWWQPLLSEDLERDGTTLMLSTTSLLPPDVLEDLAERFPCFPTLNEEARLAVATARIEGRVTNRRLQQITDMHGRDLTLMLRSLVEQRMLVPFGDRGGTWYTVAGSDFASAHHTDLLDISCGSRQDSPQSPDRFPQSPDNSPQSPDSFPQSSVSSPQSGTPRDRPGSVGQSAQQELLYSDPVAKVSSSNWSPKIDVEAAILEVCRGAYLTPREIADRLNRKPRTIQDHYLPKLVGQGLLRLKYPSEPNHPEQAYGTIPPGDVGQ